MTNKQFEEYKELQEQIKMLDLFLYNCGICYEDSFGECKGNKLVLRFTRNKDNKQKIEYKFLQYNDGIFLNVLHDFTIPKQLQIRIAKTVYDYKKEIEKRMEEL